MSLITRMRRQVAIWWQRQSTPNVYGKFSYLPPVEIACRWEDVTEEFIDTKGEKRRSHSVVYVDRLMSVGDRLKRGPIESATPINPLEFPDAYEIMRFDQDPNFKATETLLTAYL